MRLVLLSIAFALALYSPHALAQSTSLVDPTGNAIAGDTQPVVLRAKLTKDGEFIERGLVWRIFGTVKATDGKFPLIASGKGGSQTVELPTGAYLVHTTFGRASATKRITFGKGGTEETFVLDAGGLRLNALADEKNINPKYLRFAIYGIDQDEDGNRALIVDKVKPEHIVRLKAGTYHVVSNYGDINASVRADLEVSAGKVTHAVLQQRGAEVALKLVLRKGGDPVANTAWTILSKDGEKLFESNSVSPKLVLSEGSYEASVRNGDSVYVHNFDVEPGKDSDVEVMLK